MNVNECPLLAESSRSLTVNMQTRGVADTDERMTFEVVEVWRRR